MTPDRPDPERKPFKSWFDEDAARRLARQLAGAMPRFDQRRFVRLASRDLRELEFAARVQQFADAMAATLPESVPRALDVVTRSLPRPLPDCESVTDGWLQWPLGQFIADRGLDHVDASFAAMIELTQRFSAEFAVRPFVERHPREALSRLSALTAHESPHVRRWCSEGTRPRLPWGRRLDALVADPSPIWPILEALKDDEALYVRRSVANNLNDIAKDHPSAVVARCRAWSAGASAERAWTVRHALRSLVKGGDSAALAVVGYRRPRGLTATLRARPARVAIGGAVELIARLSSSASRGQHLMVDYGVHHVRQRGETSEKVFKWKTLRLAGGETRELTKRHAVRATTVRALYPGMHRVELQVNGVRIAEARFRLTG